MKLARLLLQAFGPFTDTALDFAANPANLHLIYGPNEAGKSSALRAMTDLRFGIPLRSPDDFIHASNRLRIAGVFLDDQGECLGLIRRKGRGSTLCRCDVSTAEPNADLPVLRGHELALTGGLERSDFEAMFGLNHARLRAGGDLLLKGEGELGSALFEASAGTRGIAAMLAALEADAKLFYNPHGRAHNAVINEARRQLEEQRQALRQAQTRPAEWQALYRAHDMAKAALTEIDREQERQRRLENELTELRTVEPLLREHDRAQAELDALADVPELSENARDERLAAQQTMRHAHHALHGAESEIARCTQALADLVIEPPLLEHADAIERLAAGTKGAASSRIEVQRERLVIGRIADDLASAVARIAPGRSTQDALNALPSEGDRAVLDRHLQERNRLEERLDGYRRQADGLEQAAKRSETDTIVLPDLAARQLLASALRQAQALGDVARKTADFDRQIGEFGSLLQQALSDLGTQSADTLRSSRPMLESEIADTKQELLSLDEGLRALGDEEERLSLDLEAQRLRQRQLAAEGEVVTADTLRRAREQRDAAWKLVRRVYVEGVSDVEIAGVEAFDPERPLPEAFEAAQGEADRQADLLRADTRRAAGFEECSARIDQMERRREVIADESLALAARKEAFRTDWAERLARSNLPCLAPDSLREWLGKRQNALSEDDRLVAVQADRHRTVVETATAASALAKALIAVGQTVSDAVALPSLIEQATAWEKSTTEADAKRHERAEAARSRQAELEKTRALITETQIDLESHEAALRAWHVRLFLAVDSPPEAVQARLEELQGASRQFDRLNDAHLRQAHHQAVIDDLADQASRLAALLGETTSELVEDFADRLRQRLAKSQQHDQLRSSLQRDLARAREQQRLAGEELEAQEIALKRLCAAAGVASSEALPQREERAAHKHAARTTLEMLRQRLTEASSRPESSLRQDLAGRDVIAIESQRERCRAEIARLEQEQAKARQTEELARRALEAIDDSDRAARAREAMESATARYRAALRPWARLKMAHALLSEALNRFRQRAQAPMVAAASTYFSLMTGGRYERLVADEMDDKPVLRAERADGVRIGVEAMSEGTADQLYLALRLAALELRRASHPQMPLVLDDVLITSDDERAANILRALARFAEGGQVMLFTHHRHLIDLARTVLDHEASAIHSL